MKTLVKITFAIMVASTLSVGIVGCGGGPSSTPGPETPTEHGDEDPETGEKLES